jgi:hypothetical protein
MANRTPTSDDDPTVVHEATEQFEFRVPEPGSYERSGPGWKNYHRHDGKQELHPQGDRPHYHDPQSGIVVFFDSDPTERLDPTAIQTAVDQLGPRDVLPPAAPAPTGAAPKVDPTPAGVPDSGEMSEPSAASGESGAGSGAAGSGWPRGRQQVEEDIARSLVIAQRVADQTVSKAKDEARQIIAGAKARASVTDPAEADRPIIAEVGVCTDCGGTVAFDEIVDHWWHEDPDVAAMPAYGLDGHVVHRDKLPAHHPGRFQPWAMGHVTGNRDPLTGKFRSNAKSAELAAEEALIDMEAGLYQDDVARRMSAVATALVTLDFLVEVEQAEAALAVKAGMLVRLGSDGGGS